jgi:hypothetical protein
MEMLAFGELAHLWRQEYFPAQAAHVHIAEPSRTQRTKTSLPQSYSQHQAEPVAGDKRGINY